MPAKTLITGVTGFVGQAVGEALDEAGLAWIGQAGRPRPDLDPRCFVLDLSRPVDWTGKLRGADAVVHLAGRAHTTVLDAADRDLTLRVNRDASAELAEQAVRAGVKRFIFVSSIHSYLHEQSLPGGSHYGVSKKAAEEAILEKAAGSGMSVCILRPCLMFGRGVKGNLGTMMKWLRRGIPLPLASVKNRRSFMHVRNFADIILRCLLAGKEAEGIFEAADGNVYSTPDLLRKMGTALGKPPRLLPFPPSWLRFAAGAVRKSETAEKLLGDLEVDASRLTARLGWTSRFTDDHGFAEMAEPQCVMRNA